MNLRQIKYVRGPSQLEHDVVGEVNQRGNAALTTALQTLPDPVGRGRMGIDPPNHTTAEPSAQIGGCDVYRQTIGNDRGDRLMGGQVQRRPADRSDLAGHADHRHAVRQVGRELEHPDVIVQGERLTQ